MKNNNLNIEEIKSLIPDYITGSLNEKEAILVKDYIDKYPEVNDFYNEMKSTIEFVSKVDFEEPSPQYWNNLLPNIHQKIEDRGVKYTANNPLSLLWKFLVPAAAIIILFIIYMIVNNPGEDLQDKNKTLVKTDSVNKNIEQNIVTPKIDTNTKQETTSDKIESNTEQKRNIKRNFEQKETVQQIEEKKNIVEEKKENSINENDDIADEITNEPLILGAGESGTFDNDIEIEMDELTRNEKDNLLEKLKKSDL